MVGKADFPILISPPPAFQLLSKVSKSQDHQLGGAIGRSVGNAGDLNHDGYNDIFISSLESSTVPGTVYVIFGKRGGFTDIDLSTTELSTHQQGFKIIGQPNGEFGFSVSRAGDFNKDNIDDLVIGAPGYSSNYGAAYVLFGSTSLGDIDLRVSGISTNQRGFRMTGPPASNKFGYVVASAGDVNDDGINDILVGSSPTSGLNGLVYVIFGRKGSFVSSVLQVGFLSTNNLGFEIHGKSITDHLGATLGSAGDLNNDGIDDVIIGAVSDSSSSSGAAYVIFGYKGTPIDLDFSLMSLTDSQRGFKIIGISGSQLGASVTSVGDLNKDGVDDIIVGAKSFSSNTGAVYIIYGKTNRFADIDLGQVSLSASQQGFNITGVTAGGQFGLSAALAGDINNDGVEDVIIGAPGDATYLGVAYVLYGKGNAKSSPSGNPFYFLSLLNPLYSLTDP